MTLLADLDASLAEHRRCGEPEGDVDDSMIWLACECGAGIARRADEGHALEPTIPAWTAAASC